MLDLDPADGRIAVATGIGSGIGAIFGAPLGGAVLAAEILYRDDFDPAALLPCFIASSVSYAVFGSVEGFGPLFGYVGSYRFGDPAQLGWFALIGILGGLMGILYAKGFYGIAQISAAVPRLPKWIKPAIGGLMVGAIGIAIPRSSYRVWLDPEVARARAAGHPSVDRPHCALRSHRGDRTLHRQWWIRWVFGPGMVIGAFMGGAVWRLFEPIAPSMGRGSFALCHVG